MNKNKDKTARGGRPPRAVDRGVLNILKKYDAMGDFSKVATANGVAQRDFLLAAVTLFGFTRRQMATRLGCGVNTLNKWMSPTGGDDFHAMSPLVWKFLAEIILQYDPQLGGKS